MQHKDKILYGIIAVIIIIGVLYFVTKSDKSEDSLSITSNQNIQNLTPSPTITESDSSEIFVYITGEVKKPDVYTVNQGIRIKDLINLAGGATEDADLTKINLAKQVSDEERIVVPKIGDLNTETNDTSSDGLININTADRTELTKLPRIGKVTADKIIEYREKNGGFNSVEDIKKVSGIGEKIFENISDKIKV